MEGSEQPQDIDLSGLPEEKDPFADVPNDLVEEPVAPLPEGVVPGELGGVNPSEEPPPEGEAEEFDINPAPAEPAPEPEAEMPPPEDVQTAEVEDAEVPPELQAEPDEEPQGEVETPVEDSEAPESTPPRDAGAEGNDQEEPEQETPVQKPKAKKKAARKKKSSTKKKNGERGYVILIRGKGKGEWVEAFEGPKDDEPYILPARNGTIALRRAYRKLTEDDDNPGSYTILPVPEAYYNPKMVAGRVHKQTAISIG